MSRPEGPGGHPQAPESKPQGVPANDRKLARQAKKVAGRIADIDKASSSDAVTVEDSP